MESFSEIIKFSVSEKIESNTTNIFFYDPKKINLEFFIKKSSFYEDVNNLNNELNNFFLSPNSENKKLKFEISCIFEKEKILDIFSNIKINNLSFSSVFLLDKLIENIIYFFEKSNINDIILSKLINCSLEIWSIYSPYDIKNLFIFMNLFNINKFFYKNNINIFCENIISDDDYYINYDIANNFIDECKKYDTLSEIEGLQELGNIHLGCIKTCHGNCKRCSNSTLFVKSCDDENFNKNRYNNKHDFSNYFKFIKNLISLIKKKEDLNLSKTISELPGLLNIYSLIKNNEIGKLIICDKLLNSFVMFGELVFYCLDIDISINNNNEKLLIKLFLEDILNSILNNTNNSKTNDEIQLDIKKVFNILFPSLIDEYNILEKIYFALKSGINEDHDLEYSFFTTTTTTETTKNYNYLKKNDNTTIFGLNNYTSMGFGLSNTNNNNNIYSLFGLSNNNTSSSFGSFNNINSQSFGSFNNNNNNSQSFGSFGSFNNNNSESFGLFNNKSKPSGLFTKDNNFEFGNHSINKGSKNDLFDFSFILFIILFNYFSDKNNNKYIFNKMYISSNINLKKKIINFFWDLFLKYIQNHESIKTLKIENNKFFSVLNIENLYDVLNGKEIKSLVLDGNIENKKDADIILSLVKNTNLTKLYVNFFFYESFLYTDKLNEYLKIPLVERNIELKTNYPIKSSNKI